MYKVDLNSDLGESFGAYTIGLDNEVIAHVSSVNVACGYHAGDPLVMEKTVAAPTALSTTWLVKTWIWRLPSPRRLPR